MGYIKLWVHLVWTTKNREPFLTKDIRKQILDHLLKNAIDKGIYIDFINGYLEHAHWIIERNHSSKSMMNLCVRTDLINSFLAKAGFFIVFLNPRAKARGNSARGNSSFLQI
jgi:REP element-mobilizing transposase RayT